MAEPGRAALVIAADQFVDPKFQRLRSPAKDVDSLAGVLGDAGIGGFDVKTVVNQPSDVVAQELERFFSNRKPDDLLLLYFSCHGVKDPAGRLYFVTTNTMFDLVRSTGVSASFVSEQMEYSRSKRIVVLLDCCYSGAFLKGFRARGDDSVAVDQLEGRGRAVITASRATEYAFEADDLTSENARPSMFTGAIVDGLTTGNADANGDGLVTVDELYDYVYDAVRERVAGQTPGRWIDVEGDLVIARNPNPPVRAADLPPELRRALESDAALQRLGAVSELGQWLRDGEPARRRAAAVALEQLTRDFDERVKVAALAALASAAPAAAPIAVPRLIPPTAPAPPDPPPTTGPPSVGTSHPPQAATPFAGDRRGRSAGWLAVAGAGAVLLSSYLPYIKGEDKALDQFQWYGPGAIALVALVGYAAFCILRTASSTETGLAVLVGVAPFATGEALNHVARLLNDAGYARVPDVGWLLVVAGLCLLAAAGVPSWRALRGRISLASPLGPVDNGPGVAGVGVALVALGVGGAVSIGWANVAALGEKGPFGVGGPTQSLILRLLLLTALSCVAWPLAKARAGRASARLLLVALVAVGGTVVLFLADESFRTRWFVAVALVVLVMGSATVPVVSTLLVPRRAGFAVLTGWVVASAVWIPSRIAEEGHGKFLLTALAASAMLAAYLGAQGRRPASG